MATGRDIKFNVKIDDDSKGAIKAGEALEHLADKAEQAQDKLSDMGRTAGGKVAAELTLAKERVHALAKEIDETGDLSLLKGLRAEMGKVRGLEQISKQIAGQVEHGLMEGAQAGESAMLDSLGALPSEVKGIGIAAGAALALAMTPAIGAGISAAVLGGVGLGGIAGGIAMAARSGQVKAAAEDLKSTVTSGLEDATKPFIASTVAGIGEIKTAFGDVQPIVAHIADELAPMVAKLAHGLAGMVREMAPGIEAMADAAVPMIEGLANELPRMGAAAREFGESMAAAGPGAVQFMTDFTRATEAAVVGTGKLVEGLSWLYRLSEGNPKLADLRAIIDGIGAISALTTPAVGDKLVGAFRNLDRSAGDAARSLFDVWDWEGKLINQSMGLEGDQLNLERAFQDFAQSLRDNGTGFDINTAKGLANRESMQRIAESAARVRDDVIKQTGSIYDGNKAYDAAIRRMIDMAVAAGADRKELEKLAKTYTVTIVTSYKVEGRPPGSGGGRGGGRGTVYYEAEGGIIPAAAKGLITDQPTFLLGEAGYKEAAIPEGGIPRSRAGDLLGTAASWWDMAVVPRGAMAAPVRAGGAAPGGEQTIRIVLEGTGVLTGLRKEIRIRGGNVQTVLGQ